MLEKKKLKQRKSIIFMKQVNFYIYFGYNYLVMERRWGLIFFFLFFLSYFFYFFFSLLISFLLFFSFFSFCFFCCSQYSKIINSSNIAMVTRNIYCVWSKCLFVCLFCWYISLLLIVITSLVKHLICQQNVASNSYLLPNKKVIIVS